MGMASGLTEAEIAQRAGTTPERVRELAELGIIGQGPSEARFRSGDVLRVQLVEELEAFDIAPTRVATALSERALTLSYLDKLPDAPPRSGRTYAEVCDELRISFDLLERIYAG